MKIIFPYKCYLDDDDNGPRWTTMLHGAHVWSFRDVDDLTLFMLAWGGEQTKSMFL